MIDELSSASWDWEAEVSKAREEPTVTDLSDQELRERFLADVESGKFARKLREYFERDQPHISCTLIIFRLYLDSCAILGTFLVCAKPHTLASGTDIENPLEPAPRLNSWHNLGCWHGACF